MKKLIFLTSLCFWQGIYGQVKELTSISDYLNNLDSHYKELSVVYEKKQMEYNEKINSLENENVSLREIIEKEKGKIELYTRIINDLNKNNLKQYYIVTDPSIILKLQKITGLIGVSAFYIKSNGSDTYNYHVLLFSKNNDLIEFNHLDFIDNKKVFKLYNSIVNSGLQSTLISELMISDFTNAKDGLAAKVKLESNIEKTRNYNLEKMKYDFSKIDSLKTADKNELLKAQNYYKIEYPKLKLEYDQELKIAQKKDLAKQSEYDKALKEYEKVAGNNTKMITEAEAKKYFDVFKRNLKDPYSAIFETYGIRKFKLTNEKFPCIKFIALGVRAKNGFGAYGLTNYVLTIKDGEIIDFWDEDDRDNRYTYTDSMMSSIMGYSGVACSGPGGSKPEKPESEVDKLVKPELRPFYFKYSE